MSEFFMEAPCYSLECSVPGSAPCCLYNNCQEYAQYNYVTPLYSSPDENFTVIHSQRSYHYSRLEHYIFLDPGGNTQTIPGYLKHLIPGYCQTSTTTVYDFNIPFQQPNIPNPTHYYQGHDIPNPTHYYQGHDISNPTHYYQGHDIHQSIYQPYPAGSLVGEPSIKEKQEVHSQQAEAGGNSRRKKQHSEKWRNDNKQNYAHPWLVTSLKGHGGAVLDMDFSPNGKFLATCAEDGGGSGTSSGSEGNKENTPTQTVGLSRRQKKNHRGRREDSSSPGTTVKKKTANVRCSKSALNNGISKQYGKLGWNTSDMTLIPYLQQYTINPEDLLWMGYPVESSTYPGHAIVFKPSVDYSPAALANNNNHHHNHNNNNHTFHYSKTAGSDQPDQPSGFDVNAREFVPKVFNYGSMLIKRNSDPDLKAQIPSQTASAKRTECGEGRKCIRCGKEYFVSQDGCYLTTEQCLYHWGKLRSQFDDTSVYECCKGKKNTKGCTTGKLHVWNGLHENCFNPLQGFVRTRPRKTPLPEGTTSVYAIDCEMCYTTQGFELARITVVSADGRLVYDTYVRPENEVVDYNTRFSGITAKEINKRGASKVLKDVQNDLMGFINADTILIGHGVENDLIALKMIHTMIIDTAIVFPHFYGLPYKRSLKSLVKFCLKRDIQTETTGHDSFEDARSCLELMLWKLRSDLASAPAPAAANHSVLSDNRL